MSIICGVLVDARFEWKEYEEKFEECEARFSTKIHSLRKLLKFEILLFGSCILTFCSLLWNNFFFFLWIISFKKDSFAIKIKDFTRGKVPALLDLLSISYHREEWKISGARCRLIICDNNEDARTKDLWSTMPNSNGSSISGFPPFKLTISRVLKEIFNEPVIPLY